MDTRNVQILLDQSSDVAFYFEEASGGRRMSTMCGRCFHVDSWGLSHLDIHKEMNGEQRSMLMAAMKDQAYKFTPKQAIGRSVVLISSLRNKPLDGLW